MAKAERLARALGWFSIGLGLVHVLLPRRLARLIGVRDDTSNRVLLRVVGLRELVSGVGLLRRPWSAGWLWSRVAGDAMDLALLGAALASPHTARGRVAAAMAAVIGISVLDLQGSRALSRLHGRGAGAVLDHGTLRVKRSIRVNRQQEEVYRFWRDFQNLPRFMRHLESVQVVGDRRLHWRVKEPSGTTVEWDIEITEDRPNELIAWRSLPGADMENGGSVRFTPAPAGRGTDVTVELWYSPPAGALGAAIARLFSKELDWQLREDLRAFRELVEAGEIPWSDASVGLFHPAQPPAGRPELRA